MFELQWAPSLSVSQWWVLLAGKSFRKPSVHFHSSFQQCEWCDSLLGQRDYWDQASPSSMPLAQPAKLAQSVPQAPRCLTEQPTRRTESKEAPGTPLIVHALGGSLASQHEEGPQSLGCPTAPHSALAQRFWGRYICFEALCFWGHHIVQLEIVNFSESVLSTWSVLVLQQGHISKSSNHHNDSRLKHVVNCIQCFSCKFKSFTALVEIPRMEVPAK